jgi:hypothetical protein
LSFGNEKLIYNFIKITELWKTKEEFNTSCVKINLFYSPPQPLSFTEEWRVFGCFEGILEMKEGRG